MVSDSELRFLDPATKSNALLRRILGWSMWVFFLSSIAFIFLCVWSITWNLLSTSEIMFVVAASLCWLLAAVLVMPTALIRYAAQTDASKATLYIRPYRFRALFSFSKTWFGESVVKAIAAANVARQHIVRGNMAVDIPPASSSLLVGLARAAQNHFWFTCWSFSCCSQPLVSHHCDAILWCAPIHSSDESTPGHAVHRPQLLKPLRCDTLVKVQLEEGEAASLDEDLSGWNHNDLIEAAKCGRDEGSEVAHICFVAAMVDTVAMPMLGFAHSGITGMPAFMAAIVVGLLAVFAVWAVSLSAHHYAIVCHQRLQFLLCMRLCCTNACSPRLEPVNNRNFVVHVSNMLRTALVINAQPSSSATSSIGGTSTDEAFVYVTSRFHQWQSEVREAAPEIDEGLFEQVCTCASDPEPVTQLEEEDVVHLPGRAATDEDPNVDRHDTQAYINYDT
jgi:hypothetical protein